MAADGLSGDLSPSTSLSVRLVLRSANNILAPAAPAAATMTVPDLVSSPGAGASSGASSGSGSGFDDEILLVTAPLAPAQSWITHIEARFPGLRVVYHPLQWEKALAPGTVTDAEWKRVAVLVTTGFHLPSRAAAPRLRYVQLFSAGANQVLDQPLFTDTDVVFSSANGVHGPQISEWIVATYLASNHHLPLYLDQQKEAKWRRSDEPTEDSLGHRVGILGYGSIGRQTARVATALGMEVYAYTLHPRDTPESRRDRAYAPPGTGDPDGVFPTRWFSGATAADRHAFLASGLDLLVVATPLTSSTTHLLGAAELKLLGRTRGDGTRRGGFLSNVARGPIVDTDALIAALADGTLRGAAIDVTDPEPLPDGHPLFAAKNVIITPHVSGASASYNERVYAIVEENVQRLADGRPLLNQVSRKDGY